MAISTLCKIKQKRKLHSSNLSNIVFDLEKRIVPAQIFVTNPSDAGSGSLRDAITKASMNPGDDTIVFSEFVFNNQTTISLSSSININDNTGSVNIVGPGSDKLTLSGRGLNRIFVTSTPVDISGVKLDRGYAGDGTNSGGAIQNNSRLVIRNTEITNCSAGYGGAISNNGSLNPNVSFSIINSKVYNCIAFSDGGFIDTVGSYGSVTTTIDNTTIDSCHAYIGGAVRNALSNSNNPVGYPRLIVRNSIIQNCSANADGGAIYNNCILETYDSTFKMNNSSLAGGAIVSYYQTIISGCTIASNHSGSEGGGIYLVNNATIELSTIFGNSAVYSGGGVFAWGVQGKIKQTTISGNSTKTIDQSKDVGGGGLCNSVTPGSWGPQPILTLDSVLLINNFTMNQPEDLYMTQYQNQMRSDYSIIGSTRSYVGLPDIFGNGNQLNLDGFATGNLGNYGGSVQVLPVFTNTAAFNKGNPNVVGTPDQRGITYTSADVGAFATQKKIEAHAGSGQSVVINGVLPIMLQARIVDSWGNPVAGVPVTFSVPLSGASLGLTTNQTLITDSSGLAQVTGKANKLIGAYQVTASVPGLMTAAFTITNVGPSIQALFVQNGSISRSFVRYVDLVLNDVDTANLIAASINTQTPRLTLSNTGAKGTSRRNVKLKGLVNATGNSIRLDFGKKGIGNNPTSRSADGSYLIGLDLDGNGSFESTYRFHRLLGDVNGDKVVDLRDSNLVKVNMNRTGIDLVGDVDGSGKVDRRDSTTVQKYQRQKIWI